ncbi:hypothetical protein [Streptomyces sp. NPDC002779]|uniref:hypothetical protein n=1 Tax=Streptomyces sp. NPDC002779 TaxID=3364664 RepID=UPI0036C0024D
MFRRREPVRRWFLGPTIVSAPAGSLVLGMPALSADQPSQQTQQTQASDGR